MARLASKKSPHGPDSMTRLADTSPRATPPPVPLADQVGTGPKGISQRDRARNLVRWYRDQARPFFELHDSSRLVEADADADRLAKLAEGEGGALEVCFLGSSGVGKSTLINALVVGDGSVVPSGGIGPLTAQALKVGHGERPSFRVKYHGAKQLNKVLFALRQGFKADLPAAETSDAAASDGTEVDPEDREAIERAVSEGTSPDGPSASSSREAYRKQAQLMIRGNQDEVAEVAYLIDGLREVLGQGTRYGTALRAEDRERIERLRLSVELVRAGQPYELFGGRDDLDFRSSLEDHASGFLAPLIQRMDVRWNSDLLSEGLCLVDLPGVGVAGDIYRETTNRHIREDARAVVIVVDRSGLTEANVDLLRSSGFLNRLLHASDDPAADPVSLAVAVVRLDDIAESHYQDDRGSPRRKRWEHFVDACERSEEHVRNKLAELLKSVWESADAQLGEAQDRVLSKILEDLQVFPISAREYRKHLEDDEDLRPFTKDPEQTGVPRMIGWLAWLARERRKGRDARLDQACAETETRCGTSLRLIQAQWAEDKRAAEEAEQLRGELDAFLIPKREEFRARQGSFRQFLKATVPEKIEGMMERAKRRALKGMLLYVDGLRGAHWKTLQCAVVRGGTYHGARHIELPADFALKFEEPIAEAWGRTVLDEIRRETRQYADDCLALVDELVDWARGQKVRIQLKVLEAQRDAIQSDAQRLNAVGREVIASLRERVKNDLIKGIEGPIRDKCKAFVDEGLQRNPGAKARMLELFRELAAEATEVAAEPARKVLLKNYAGVEAEIAAILKRHDDPLRSAAEAIVAPHAKRLERSGMERRAEILAEIGRVLTLMPVSDRTAKAAS